MEKYQENLKEAIRHLQIADHMTYVTYPLVNEKRLLLKIFEEIYKTISYIINAVSCYESEQNKFLKSQTEEGNIENFINKFSKEYFISNDQIKKILEIIENHKRHKESAIEFVKRDKLIIMSDSLKIQMLNIEKIKEYLTLSKELLMRVGKRIKI